LGRHSTKAWEYAVQQAIENETRFPVPRILDDYASQYRGDDSRVIENPCETCHRERASVKKQCARCWSDAHCKTRFSSVAEARMYGDAVAACGGKPAEDEGWFAFAERVAGVVAEWTRPGTPEGQAEQETLI